MDAATTNGAGQSSLGGLFNDLLDAGTKIFTAKTTADTAKKTANASIMESMASIAKSKYTLIAVGVLVVGGILYFMFRKKS